MFKFVDPSPVYLVAFHITELDPDCDIEADNEETSDVKEIVICRNMHSVGDAIHSRKNGMDWAIFEVVGDKTERRAILYESDGRTVKNIE